MTEDKNNHPYKLYQWHKLKLRKTKNNKNKHVFFCLTDISNKNKPKGNIVIYDYNILKQNKNNKWNWQVYNDFLLDGSYQDNSNKIFEKINFNNEINSSIAFHEEILGLFVEIAKSSPLVATQFKINYWETLQPSCYQFKLNDLEKHNVCGELIRQFILSFRK